MFTSEKTELFSGCERKDVHCSTVESSVAPCGYLVVRRTVCDISKPRRHSDVIVVSDIQLTEAVSEARAADKLMGEI